MDLMSTDQAYRSNPFPLYTSLRESEPVAKGSINGMTGWLVTRYDLVRPLLTDPRLSSNPSNEGGQAGRGDISGNAPDPDGPFAHQMVMMDAPDHTRLRRLVTKGFTARRVELLRTRVQEIADELIDAMPPGGTDLTAAFAAPLPLIVIMEILGVAESDRDAFVHWCKIVTDGVPETADQIPEAWAQLLTLFYATVGAKSAANADTDLLSALVALRDEGDRLTTNELVSIAVLIMLGGHLTTVDLIGSAMLALLTHPDQLEAARGNPTAVVEETLRHSPPLEMPMARFALEDLVVEDVHIARGDAVFLVISAANHDPDRFSVPDEFDVRRDASGHLAFGHGIHHCLGAPLARLEGEIAIGTLLARLPDMQLDIDPATIQWRANPMQRGPLTLPVTY
jgi:cytochrome P450